MLRHDRVIFTVGNEQNCFFAYLKLFVFGQFGLTKHFCVGNFNVFGTIDIWYGTFLRTDRHRVILEFKATPRFLLDIVRFLSFVQRNRCLRSEHLLLPLSQLLAYLSHFQRQGEQHSVQLSAYLQQMRVLRCDAVHN